MTPAGTSNELDVQDEWEENTHTHCTVLYCALLNYAGLGGANPAVNTPRPSRGTRIESCDFIVLIGDP